MIGLPDEDLGSIPYASVELSEPVPDQDLMAHLRQRRLPRGRLQLIPEGHQVLTRFLLARHQWLATLLADWPPAERREFARLICRFTGDIDRHLGELNR